MQFLLDMLFLVTTILRKQLVYGKNTYKNRNSNSGITLYIVNHDNKMKCLRTFVKETTFVTTCYVKSH